MAFITERYSDQIYALLRFVTGFLFLWHGTVKLFSIPQPFPYELSAYVVYIAGPIEMIGGILVAVGLYTRWASFVCSGLMAFAYFIAHAPKGILPIMNNGDLAVLYCFVFLYLSAQGPGIWSVDAWRQGRR
ncbi:MAG: DoxX family protein [Gammaproteobacteria bacterium]